MAADHALEQPGMAEPVQAAVLHVALAAGEHQRQVARRAGFEKALLQRDEQLVRRAVAAVAGRRDDVAIVNDGDCVARLDDFLQSHGVTFGIE